MTPDERTLLARFLDDLGQARGVAKDRDADDLIRQAVADNPDAAYLLLQHAIVADQSLHAAQARIAELERAQSEQAQPTSFLPQRGPWGAPTSPAAYAPPPASERPGVFSSGGGLGSFLRSAGTTAAGVAGGEMLFSGLSDLFGGHGGGFGGRPEEVVVNNYGDGDGGGDGNQGFLDGGDFDQGDPGQDDRGSW